MPLLLIPLIILGLFLVVGIPLMLLFGLLRLLFPLILLLVLWAVVRSFGRSRRTGSSDWQQRQQYTRPTNRPQRPQAPRKDVTDSAREDGQTQSHDNWDDF